jgi:hypothetical protein
MDVGEFFAHMIHLRIFQYIKYIIMGILLFLGIFAYILYITSQVKREQADKLLLFNKSKPFSDFENSLNASVRGNLNKLVEEDYFRKATEMGHSDAEAAAFWREFSKLKHDNRFLKNLAKVRAKYVR